MTLGTEQAAHMKIRRNKLNRSVGRYSMRFKKIIEVDKQQSYGFLRFISQEIGVKIVNEGEGKEERCADSDHEQHEGYGSLRPLPQEVHKGRSHQKELEVARQMPRLEHALEQKTKKSVSCKCVL